MKNYYIRTLKLAHYILDNDATIRKTAKVFGMAKSTVHYDLANRLPYIDEELYFQVKSLLKLNFSQKHIRGGESTKNKYKNKKTIN